MCAYGPVTASFLFFEMWPDAQARTSTPMRAITPPTARVSGVGRAQYQVCDSENEAERKPELLGDLGIGQSRMPAQKMARDDDALDL